MFLKSVPSTVLDWTDQCIVVSSVDGWVGRNDDQFQARKKTSPLPHPAGGCKVFFNPAKPGKIGQPLRIQCIVKSTLCHRLK